MKHINRIIFSVVLFALLPAMALAQKTTGASDTWLWPIEGQKAGSGIIAAPQGYIDKELNFGNLVIGATEGANVLCPVDGTVVAACSSYLQSLSYSSNFRDHISKSFNVLIANWRKSLAEKGNSSFDPKYIHGEIGIRTDDGRVVYISGLTGDTIFKSGQKIKKGEVIGKVGFWYKPLVESCICVTVSEKTMSSDPMTPFGIKTSFVKAKEAQPIKSLTTAQAIDDFQLYIKILRDCYPGLYDVMTEDGLQKYEERSLVELQQMGSPSDSGKIAYNDFRRFMVRVLSTIHDSHFYLYPPLWSKNTGYPPYQPAVFFGWFNDTLQVTRATKEYATYLRREIVSVNGIPADSVKNIILSQIYEYESNVEDYKQYELSAMGMASFFHEPYGNGNFDMVLEFADGSNVDIKGLSTKRGLPKYTTSWTDFFYVNWNKDGYSYKMLNDSTAYLSLTTFTLNQVAEDKVVSFIDSVGKADVKHLIVDVRNNPGGDSQVLNHIFSCIANDTLKVNGYARVNRRGGFPTMEHSLSYTFATSEKEEEAIFPNFTPLEGQVGFFSESDEYTFRTIVPDSLIHYGGKVYVLTNENAISAATLLPAMVLRSHRGVVVGRETRTAYHFMNALKFSDFRLPNSQITICVPLVHLVFDDAVVDRTPYGRGVIPDYYVPLTLDEIEWKNGDAVLNRALQLIAEGQYLSPEDPFEEIDNPKPTETSHLWIYIALGAALCIAILLLFLRHRRR